MLILGTKYVANDFRAETLRRLRRMAPRTVEEWDSQLEGSADLLAINMKWDDDIVFEFTNISLEYGLYRLHTTCLYHCCQLDAHELIDGRWTTHGTTADYLPSQDLASCIDARSSLVAMSFELIDTVSKAAARDDCQRCYSVMKTVWDRWKLGEDLPRPLERHDPMGLTRKTLYLMCTEAAICKHCTKTILSVHRKFRQQIMDSLPILLHQASVPQDDDDDSL